MVLTNGVVGAFGHTATAAVALGLGDLGGLPRHHGDGPIGAGRGADPALAPLGADAAVGPHPRHDRLDLPGIGEEHARRSRGRATPLSDTVGDVLGPLHRAGQEHPVGGRVHRAQLGVVLHVKPTRAARQGQRRSQRLGVQTRDGGRREAHHLRLQLDDLAQCLVFGLDEQVVSLGVLGDLRGTPLDEADAHLARPVVELLIAFRRRADVHVKDSDIHVWVRLLQQQGVLDGVHAAKTGAVLVVTGIT